MNNDKSVFGERLKHARIAAGLSQERLSSAIGVSVGTVSRWERAIHAPSKIERKLARALNVSWAWLLGSIGNNEAPAGTEASNSAR